LAAGYFVQQCCFAVYGKKNFWVGHYFMDFHISLRGPIHMKFSMTGQEQDDF
jgi:hypothetical protein